MGRAWRDICGLNLGKVVSDQCLGGGEKGHR